MASTEQKHVAHADPLIQQVLLGEAVARGGYVILVADDQMQYVAVSDAALELLGYTRDELLRMTVPEVVVESDASDRYREFVSEGVQRGRITLRCKDGRHVTASYDARKTQVSALSYFVSNGAIHTTDAEYLSLDNWATYQDGYDIAPYFNGPNFGDLMVNNAFVDWGQYSPTHTYTLAGSFSGSVNLTVFDGNGNYGPVDGKYPGWYGDNSGSLTVDVYKVNPRPTTAGQCKKDGWQTYGIFKNQGDCVSYVATDGRNQPAG